MASDGMNKDLSRQVTKRLAPSTLSSIISLSTTSHQLILRKSTELTVVSTLHHTTSHMHYTRQEQASEEGHTPCVWLRVIERAWPVLLTAAAPPAAALMLHLHRSQGVEDTSGCPLSPFACRCQHCNLSNTGVNSNEMTQYHSPHRTSRCTHRGREVIRSGGPSPVLPRFFGHPPSLFAYVTKTLSLSLNGGTQIVNTNTDAYRTNPIHKACASATCGSLK